MTTGPGRRDCTVKSGLRQKPSWGFGLEVFVHLLALLILARAFGEAAERLGQPASVGEITAGVVLAGAAALFGASVPFVERLAASDVLAPA